MNDVNKRRKINEMFPSCYLCLFYSEFNMRSISATFHQSNISSKHRSRCRDGIISVALLKELEGITYMFLIFA